MTLHAHRRAVGREEGNAPFEPCPPVAEFTPWTPPKSCCRLALPRRLMSGSGLATSLVLETQPESWGSGVIESIFGSRRPRRPWETGGRSSWLLLRRTRLVAPARASMRGGASHRTRGWLYAGRVRGGTGIEGGHARLADILWRVRRRKGDEGR